MQTISPNSTSQKLTAEENSTNSLSMVPQRISEVSSVRISPPSSSTHLIQNLNLKSAMQSNAQTLCLVEKIHTTSQNPTSNLNQMLQKWVQDANHQETREGRIFIKDELIKQGAQLSDAKIEIHNLELHNCGIYIDFPDELTVLNNLQITDCPFLKTLENVIVNNNLYISNCSKLEKLPSEINLKGTFFLEKCPAITSLPNAIKVGGHFYIYQCNGILSLPSQLEIYGHIRIGSESLTSLPDHLIALGDLDLRGCTKLEELNGEYTVYGDFDLSYSKIKKINGNLIVYGECNCKNSLELFDASGVTLFGKFNFSNCPSLRVYPQQLRLRTFSR